MPAITHAQQGDTLAVICWRHYGRTDGGVVERVLDANPSLANAGPVLPHGTRVALPELPPAAASSAQLIQLWT